MFRRLTQTLAAGLAAIVAALLIGTTAPSVAAPPTKIGPVTNLTLTAAAAPAGYRLTSTWGSLSTATSYTAVITNAAGATLASVTQTATTWSVDLPGTPNTNMKVTVTPSGSGKTRGTPASAIATLPDLKAPVGVYKIARSETDYEATLTEESLSDDGTPTANIQREINWGDGSVVDVRPGATLSHVYPGIGRYLVTVKLTDSTGNTVTLTLKAVVFGDTTAPTGAFDAGPADALVFRTTVTLSQTSLWDEVTPNESIERVVAWGDGSTSVWPTGTTITHVYTLAGTYTPTVTLTDEAGNIAVVASNAVVVQGDNAAPTGAFDAGPATALANWTRVTLTQTALNDNFSPNELIGRVVAWGDGSMETWTAGATLTHVYKVAGTYLPSVTLKDESGNTAKVSSDQVVVTADTAAPVVKVTNKKSTSLRKWRAVKGTVRDAGVGASSVSVVAIEKTSKGWRAYVGGKWKRAATKGKAWKIAKVQKAVPVDGRWKVRLAKLQKGSLKVRVTAVDKLANTSAVVSRSQKLTKA